MLLVVTIGTIDGSLLLLLCDLPAMDVLAETDEKGRAKVLPVVVSEYGTTKLIRVEDESAAAGVVARRMSLWVR